jgi:hypothetical protein
MDLGSLLSPAIVTVTGDMSTIIIIIIITTAITGATGTKIKEREDGPLRVLTLNSRRKAR